MTSQHQSKIAFCITCKGRAQHIRQTLSKNLAYNADYESAVFIIVNYNSPDNLMEELKATHSDSIDSGKVIVYSVKDVDTFRMAHAKNIAHRLGILEGADILVNLDADNLTGSGFATYINEQFKLNSEIFMWAKMIPGTLPRGISGRIVISKHAFLNVGGYDERFETWSPDDKDFNQRLTRAGYTPQEIPNEYLNGIRHTDRIRFKEYPHVKPTAAQYDEPLPECDTTVVNYGKIGVCIVTRNFETTLIELGPIPTRIFGIGVHKTGTTSLHAAFKILDYTSAHWKSARWAKTIWTEIKEFGRSLLLEKCHATCDLPITLLYKHLDKLYPGSKFILTIRDEKEWIQSIKNHWHGEINPYRSTWKTDPFSHRIHREFYGQQNFDAEVFINKYRKHNEEVIAYFKDRPNDLLVQYVDENVNWDSLCEFLGHPVPSIPYPKLNTTSVATTDADKG